MPITSNVSKLVTSLSQGPIAGIIEDLLKSKNKIEAKAFLANENNFFSAIKYIVQSQTMMKFFVPLLSKEKMISLMTENETVSTFILKNINEENSFLE